MNIADRLQTEMRAALADGAHYQAETFVLAADEITRLTESLERSDRLLGGCTATIEALTAERDEWKRKWEDLQNCLDDRPIAGGIRHQQPAQQTTMAENIARQIEAGVSERRD